MASIWKDTYISVSSSLSPLTYYITKGGTEIYRGKAYVKPQAITIDIKVNDIAANYLSQSFPSNGTSSNSNAIGTFNVYNASGNTLLGSVTFLYDWSYDTDYTSGNLTLSHPINSKNTSGMYQFNTFVSGGTVYTTRTTVGSGNDCGDYALYYLNRYGGWDAILMQGNTKQTDNYERYDMINDDNTKQTYLNVIRSSYTLNSGWLSDAQSKNFAFNLMGSNQVYLHNLTENTVERVNITATSTEYKQFKTDKMINYTINVEVAKTKENR